MKTIIYIAFSLMVFASCSSNQVIIAEEDIKEDLFYLENDIDPYSGICKIVYSETNTVKEELTYRKGILEGKAVSRYPNGNIKRKGTYHKGNIHGTWIFWDENGNKVFEVNYNEDKLNGLFVSYFPDGRIKEKGNYKKNKKTGNWVCYNDKGIIVNKKSY